MLRGLVIGWFMSSLRLTRWIVAAAMSSTTASPRAGVIASSHGKANAAPAPRNKVRREMGQRDFVTAWTPARGGWLGEFILSQGKMMR